MAVAFEVTFAEKYTDKQNQQKTKSVRIGCVIETKNGYMLKLDVIPVGFDGWAYLNEPKPQEQYQNNNQGQQQPQQGNNFRQPMRPSGNPQQQPQQFNQQPRQSNNGFGAGPDQLTDDTPW